MVWDVRHGGSFSRARHQVSRQPAGRACPGAGTGRLDGAQCGLRSRCPPRHRACLGPGSRSVTVISPERYPSGPRQLPAIHIGSTGAAARSATQLDIADILLEGLPVRGRFGAASCHLPASLLAAIGEVESGSLAGRPLDAQHRTSIFGPVLDGHHGFRAIADTDNGRLDGNRTWDRAMGPLQFIPSTWRTFGVDGDGDGVADPQDVEDSTATAAAYLCYGGRDLSNPVTLRSAILAYNASSAYQQLVMTYQKRFAAFGLDSRVTVVGLSVGAAGGPVVGSALEGVFTGPSGTSSNAATRKHAAAAAKAKHHGTAPSARATARRRRVVDGIRLLRSPHRNPDEAPDEAPLGTVALALGRHHRDAVGRRNRHPFGRPDGLRARASVGFRVERPGRSPSATASDDGSGDTVTCPPCGTTDEPGDDPTGSVAPSPSADPTAEPGDPATCEPPVTEPSSSTAP